MPRPSLALLTASALSLSLPACKTSKDDAPAAASAEDTSEQAQVDRLCETLNQLSLAYLAGVVEMDIEGKDIKKPAVRAKLREICKTQSLDLVKCAKKLALDDPKCDRALEAAAGMTDSRPQGEGPAPRWSLKLPFEIFDLAPAPGGVVAVTGKRELARVEGGELKWQVELDEASTYAAWVGGCLLTGAGGELRCYDEAGELSWSRQLVSGAESRLRPIEAGPEPGRATVLSREGDIFRVDVEVCAADSEAEGCAPKLGRVPAIGGMRVSLLPSGALLGSSDDGLALVSATGELLAERAFDYATSYPAGALVVGGHDILRARPECEPKAEDCFEVLATDEDIELAAPLALPEGDVIYVDRFGVIHRSGAKSWEIDAGNDGDPILHRGTLYSLGHELGLDTAAREAPPQLRAIEPASGRTLWITPLGTQRAGLLEGYIFYAAGELVYVATMHELFAVPVDEAG